MFVSFFYLLRANGFGTTLTEWLVLIEALTKNLHRTSLAGFYDLCRTILVKSEKDYDRFDVLFLNYFDEIAEAEEGLSQQLLEWLEHPELLEKEIGQFLLSQGLQPKSNLEIQADYQKRLKEQTSQHNGGSYWVGTQGFSNFGNSGYVPQGIRAGGKGRYRRAFQVAGERNFQDFRNDKVLGVRQFQNAFRLLRQLSHNNDRLKTEFDVEETISKTCNNGGILSVQLRRPRRNAIKVLLLMDSGGSMECHVGLCARLFQAATESNSFKELKIYYFHNCVYNSLYKNPQMRRQDRVATEQILKECGSEYKLIMVGDALMEPGELLEKRYDWRTQQEDCSGIDWLRQLSHHFPYAVWLNPENPPDKDYYWGITYRHILSVFDMFPLTLSGLEAAIKKLLIKK